MDTLKQYIPLCFFNYNPLALTRSESLFRVSLITYYCVRLFLQANMIEPWEAFWEVNIETILTLLFIALMMTLNRNFNAYLQVVTAFLICENLISLIAIPVFVWVTVTDDASSYLFASFLVLWLFSLVTYLIKQVLDVNILASIAVSFLYFIFTYGAAYSLMFLM